MLRYPNPYHSPHLLALIMAVFDAFTTVPPSHKPFLFVASSNLRNYTYVRRRQLSSSQEDRSTSNYRSHAHASHCRMASTLIICLYVCKHTTYVLCVFIFAVFTSCPLFRYFVVLCLWCTSTWKKNNFHRTPRLIVGHWNVYRKSDLEDSTLEKNKKTERPKRKSSFLLRASLDTQDEWIGAVVLSMQQFTQPRAKNRASLKCGPL